MSTFRNTLRMVLFLTVAIVFSWNTARALPAGDLSVYISPTDLPSALGVAPGDSVNFAMLYVWVGDGPAANARLTLTPSPEIAVTGFSVPPTSQSNGTITWELGTIENTYVTILVSGTVSTGATEGTVLTTTAAITADVVDEDETNNTAVYTVDVVGETEKMPDLFIKKLGSLEMRLYSEGLFNVGELGLPVDFSLMYWNMGTGAAADVQLTDTLPDGFSYISADPEPSGVNGNILTWDLGSMDFWSFGEVRVTALPTAAGSFTNRAEITTSTPEGNNFASGNLDNVSEYPMMIEYLLSPVVTHPSSSTDSDSFITTIANPRVGGLAKAGATVTMYSGPASHYGDDVSGMTPVGSAVAGSDRVWSIQPTELTEAKEYYLYFRAELDGEVSGVPRPLLISVNASLEEAGFDMDAFSIGSEDAVNNPGGLGGTTGGMPGEDIIITLRQTAPDGIAADTTMWALHALHITVTDNGQTYDDIVPVHDVTYAGQDPLKCFKSWDFVYIISGYGAGARITVKFSPVVYACGTGIPEEGTGDGDGGITVTEILIDPAGYVYDLDIAGEEYEWPAVPPENSLISNATVTAWERTGDTDWEVWDAESRNQVNPQITDTTTEDKVKQKGYFAFFVPAGQYRVHAAAPDYAEYTSPVLTVINEPIYHNVGMRRSKQVESGVHETATLSETPKQFTVLRNFPNPFNPSTNIVFRIPSPGFTTLSIYNVGGQKVRELIAKNMPAGVHTVTWDGRDSAGERVSTGVYFSLMTSGKITGTGRMMLIK